MSLLKNTPMISWVSSPAVLPGFYVYRCASVWERETNRGRILYVCIAYGCSVLTRWTVELWKVVKNSSCQEDTLFSLSDAREETQRGNKQVSAMSMSVPQHTSFEKAIRKQCTTHTLELSRWLYSSESIKPWNERKNCVSVNSSEVAQLFNIAT